MNRHDKDEIPKRLFPFIWHFLRQHKGAALLFAFLSIVAGFLGPINSLLMKRVIDLLPEAREGNTGVLVLPVALIVINFLVLDNVTWRSITYISCKRIPRILGAMIETLTERTLRQSTHFFQEQLSGRLTKQITNLADGVEKILYDSAPNFLRAASLVLAAFATAYSVNPLFCLVLIVWFIFFWGTGMLMSRRLVRLSDAHASAESTLSGELVDAISNQSNIRFFAQTHYEQRRMRPVIGHYLKTYYNMHFYGLIMHGILGISIAVSMASSGYFLVYLYGKKLVTAGDFALIFGLTMETGYVIWYTLLFLDQFNEAVGKCKQSLSTLMLPVEIQDHAEAKPLRCTAGQITFEGVAFQYKGTAPLFQNKSIRIEAGEKVGLVGYSGSGKSTFVNLILRLYDISSGRISIDGQDIRDVTQESLRAHIGMIPQDPSLFNRSLMENIRYGRPDASDDAVIDAAEKAHAHAFIETLPQGYQSIVGERGVKLSGGQRQRIAIARAILKGAPILILDEATSQLDSVTETLIQDSLWNLMQGKTTLIIAHRLSTLLRMDRILVFDQGQIVDDGTHQRLLEKGGRYKQLWDAQVGGFLGDAR